jgi:hypothetical protein
LNRHFCRPCIKDSMLNFCCICWDPIRL